MVLLPDELQVRNEDLAQQVKARDATIQSLEGQLVTTSETAATFKAQLEASQRKLSLLRVEDIVASIAQQAQPVSALAAAVQEQVKRLEGEVREACTTDAALSRCAA